MVRVGVTGLVRGLCVHVVRSLTVIDGPLTLLHPLRGPAHFHPHPPTCPVWHPAGAHPTSHSSHTPSRAGVLPLTRPPPTAGSHPAPQPPQSDRDTPAQPARSTSRPTPTRRWHTSAQPRSGCHPDPQPHTPRPQPLYITPHAIPYAGVRGRTEPERPKPQVRGVSSPNV